MAALPMLRASMRDMHLWSTALTSKACRKTAAAENLSGVCAAYFTLEIPPAGQALSILEYCWRQASRVLISDAVTLVVFLEIAVDLPRLGRLDIECFRPQSL